MPRWQVRYHSLRYECLLDLTRSLLHASSWYLVYSYDQYVDLIFERLKFTSHAELRICFKRSENFLCALCARTWGSDSASLPSRRLEISCLRETKLWSTFTRGNGRICNAAEVQRRKVIFGAGMFSSSVRFSSNGIESHESRYRYFVMDRQTSDRIAANFQQLRNDEILAETVKAHWKDKSDEATRMLIDITISRFPANPICRKFVESLITLLAETRMRADGWRGKYRGKYPVV